MEMHQLRYFVALAKTGSFRRAAENCHVSQPSLSQQIMKLEDELGEKLFERLRRSAVLTAAGELFRARAERILQEVEDARREVGDVRGVVRGKVQLGVLPTIAPYLLPKIIQRFSAQYPAVELVVHEDMTARLVQVIEANELDLAIASLPIIGRGLEVKELFTEELFVALPQTHRLARKKAIAVHELRNEKFVVMKEGHCLGAQAVQFCREKGFDPQVTCRTAQVETIQALVQAGLGVSLVPEMARANGCPGQVYRSLAGTKPTRTIALITRKNRQLSAAAREFKKLVETSEAD
jgi:LysR family transcriptional regulator, hydrogen peroxide-inducible genes activator